MKQRTTNFEGQNQRSGLFVLCLFLSSIVIYAVSLIRACVSSDMCVRSLCERSLQISSNEQPLWISPTSDHGVYPYASWIRNAPRQRHPCFSTKGYRSLPRSWDVSPLSLYPASTCVWNVGTSEIMHVERVAFSPFTPNHVEVGPEDLVITLKYRYGWASW